MQSVYSTHPDPNTLHTGILYATEVYDSFQTLAALFLELEINCIEYRKYPVFGRF